MLGRAAGTGRPALGPWRGGGAGLWDTLAFSAPARCSRRAFPRRAACGLLSGANVASIQRRLRIFRRGAAFSAPCTSGRWTCAKKQNFGCAAPGCCSLAVCGRLEPGWLPLAGCRLLCEACWPPLAGRCPSIACSAASLLRLTRTPSARGAGRPQLVRAPRGVLGAAVTLCGGYLLTPRLRSYHADVLCRSTLPGGEPHPSWLVTTASRGRGRLVYGRHFLLRLGSPGFAGARLLGSLRLGFVGVSGCLVGLPICTPCPSCLCDTVCIPCLTASASCRTSRLVRCLSPCPLALIGSSSSILLHSARSRLLAYGCGFGCTMTLMFVLRLPPSRPWMAAASRMRPPFSLHVPGAAATRPPSFSVAAC